MPDLIIPHKNARDGQYLQDSIAIEQWQKRHYSARNWTQSKAVQLLGSTTSPTLGTGGSAIIRFKRYQTTCHFAGIVTAGSAGFLNGSGNVIFKFPANYLISTNNLTAANPWGNTIVGNGWLFTGSTRLVSVELNDSQSFTFRYDNSGGSGLVTYAAPFTWTNGTILTFQGTYELLSA